ncbi:hypothetical protein NLI96_g10962 [Meripilus lineatus]|uniref:Uncharacterized protein n=1 Tax=Meripilus lineatus TaxID=2056292 RepID=A0AAD5YDU7_9APHY|nr:hypothetical protein NLI96_g10962 [Physisporinus lineatus]
MVDRRSESIGMVGGGATYGDPPGCQPGHVAPFSHREGIAMCSNPKISSKELNLKTIDNKPSISSSGSVVELVDHDLQRSPHPTKEPLQTLREPSTQLSCVGPSTGSLKRKRGSATDSALLNEAKTQVLAGISTEASGTRPTVITSTVSRPTTLFSAFGNPGHGPLPLTGSLQTPMTTSRAKGKEREVLEAHLPHSTLKSLPQPPTPNITKENPPPSIAVPTTSSIVVASSSTSAGSTSNVPSSFPSKPSTSTSLPQNAAGRTKDGLTSLLSTKGHMKKMVVTGMEEIVQEKLNALVSSMVDECFLSIAQLLKETFGKP